MSEQHESPTVRISQSSFDLDSLVASFDDDPELKNNLQMADVVILPTDLSPEYEGPAFPISTHGVFQRLRRELGDGATVEAAVSEEDWAEFEYRSETDIILPALYVAEKVLLPLVIGILASFIHDHLKGRKGQPSDYKVKSKFHFKRTPHDVVLDAEYDGPADTFERVTKEQLRALGIPVDEDRVSDPEENDDDPQSN